MGDDSSFFYLGAAGSRYGDSWDEKGHTNIVRIFVSHGDRINSIQFQYVENGNLVMSRRFGYNNGNNYDVVKLNYPAEYITWISGHTTVLSHRSDCISSITFGTNRGKYGPFGRFTTPEKEFNFQLGEENQFGGFHGSSNGDAITSIGVYLKPIKTLECPVNKNVVKHIKKEG